MRSELNEKINDITLVTPPNLRIAYLQHLVTVHSLTSAPTVRSTFASATPSTDECMNDQRKKVAQSNHISLARK